MFLLAPTCHYPNLMPSKKWRVLAKNGLIFKSLRTILNDTVRFRSPSPCTNFIEFECVLVVVISRFWLVLQPLFTNA
jgi:hypothetical protein